MRRTALLCLPMAALLAASVAFAAHGARAARPESLADAVARTRAADTLRFALTARIGLVTALRPYTLHVSGAQGPDATRVHLEVEDVRDASGRRLTGPVADEWTDGTFLYLRSTMTRSLVGDLWVRERLDALGPGSAELKTLHRVTPGAILPVLVRARTTGVGGRGRVFHAVVAYDDPVVRRSLRGLEGNTEFRALRLTAWVGRDGLVRRVRLTGRTADGSSTFRLVARLRGSARPVTIAPPAAGAFVDFDAARLAA